LTARGGVGPEPFNYKQNRCAALLWLPGRDEKARPGPRLVLPKSMAECTPPLAKCSSGAPVLMFRRGGWYIFGNRHKNGKYSRVMIPRSLAQQLVAWKNPGELEYFFWESGEMESSRGAYCKDLTKLFKAANVQMTSHLFRPHFISEELAKGTPISDVADMAGNSEVEIRQTYKHAIQKGNDRVTALRKAAWLAEGFDAHGDPLPKKEDKLKPVN
jgi:hypothetical protein